MRVPIRKRLAPGRTQKSLQIPIMRCSAVASLLAYFFSRRQARSRFYRALLADISNALPLKATGLYRCYLQLITNFWGRILVRRLAFTWSCDDALCEFMNPDIIHALEIA